MTATSREPHKQLPLIAPLHQGVEALFQCLRFLIGCWFGWGLFKLEVDVQHFKLQLVDPRDVMTSRNAAQRLAITVLAGSLSNGLMS
ncbi:hypothetical protein LP415_02105 [Polaromonas sp. P1(28)-8]|nr:hypothetical protein LP415_02105 [Polaromonas sp. P1(28)-8]